MSPDTSNRKSGWPTIRAQSSVQDLVAQRVVQTPTGNDSLIVRIIHIPISMTLRPFERRQALTLCPSFTATDIRAPGIGLRRNCKRKNDHE
jgi:hypothetical protein